MWPSMTSLPAYLAGEGLQGRGGQYDSDGQKELLK